MLILLPWELWGTDTKILSYFCWSMVFIPGYGQRYIDQVASRSYKRRRCPPGSSGTLIDRMSRHLYARYVAVSPLDVVSHVTVSHLNVVSRCLAGTQQWKCPT